MTDPTDGDTGEFDFAEYREKHNLKETDHDRVYWTTRNPDDRAFESACAVAEAFDDLYVVGSESRVQTSDVRWELGGDDQVVVIGYYPLNANKWDQEMIPAINEALNG